MVGRRESKCACAPGHRSGGPSALPSPAAISSLPPSEASLGPPSSRTTVIGKPQWRSAIRANSTRDPRSVRPTAAVRCAEVRSMSRPAGHSESGWSDDVSADVERTPDSTSSSENLTQTFRSRRPRSPTPLPRLRSEPVAPDGAVRQSAANMSSHKHPALAGPCVEDALWSCSGTRCLRPSAPGDGLAMLERQLGRDAL